MTAFDHDTIDLIRQIISPQVSEDNFEQIHGALVSGKKQMIPKQEIVDKYLELAAFHTTNDDLRSNIAILEETRELVTSDYPVVYQIAKSLTYYWKEYSEELSETDIIWFAQYLQKVDDGLSDSNIYYALKGKLGGLYSLIQKVNNAETQLEQDGETAHTFFLSRLTSKQYEGLTPDERKLRVAEILGKKLRELYNTRSNDSETGAKDKSDGS
jgi:hypothetical protein